MQDSGQYGSTEDPLLDEQCGTNEQEYKYSQS